MIGLAGSSQAYRGTLLRLPRASGRRGRAPHHTAATYVRTHVYIGSGQPLPLITIYESKKFWVSYKTFFI